MKNTSIHERIYQRIKDEIINKKIFPGSRIVEDDIAKGENVNRAIVRTAINRLQSEGLVKIIPNKGAYVYKPTYHEIINMYNVRLYLELGAASLAIEHVTDEMIERMETCYQAQLDLKSHFSITEYAVMNRQFHWEIVMAAQNEYYTRYLNEIYNVVHVFVVYYDSSKDNAGSLRTHRMILDALKERSPSKLAEAVRVDNAIGITDLRDSGLL